MATTLTVSSNGKGPTTLSLTWTQTNDVFFVSYTVQYSTAGSNGPWTTLVVITDYRVTSQYVYAMSPGGTTWWQVIDTDSFGSATSNQYQVTQPAVATLTYTRPTATSAQFSWNNPASYGGLVGFASYQVMESINGGSYSAATTITVETTLSYTVQGLSSSTSYAFYLITTDQCNSCSGGASPSSSNSNVVSFTTAPPLSVQASASPSATDVGLAVAFTCAATGGTSPFSDAWTFGDGTTGSGSSATHSYSSPGSFTATCTVTDSFGTQASSPVSVQVAPAPSVSATVNRTSAAAAPGTSLSFTATGSGGSGSYTFTWSFGDGSSGSGATSIHAYTSPGTYTAAVTLRDSYGGSATASVSVTVAYLVVTAAESATAAMTGDLITFTASATGGAGGPYTYAWNFGDGGTGTGASATHAFGQAGTFTVRVTVTDASGGTNTTSLAAIAVQSPSPFAGAGLPLYGAIAAVVIVAGILGAFLVVRRRKRRVEPKGDSQQISPPPGA
jgi:PKD repeat protein